ncbi:DUF982 domain-containing protein [Mesorhizobium sp. M0189]|nr:DUF982 domain-containing protein [Mesorhizobium sp. LSHC420B00]
MAEGCTTIHRRAVEDRATPEEARKAFGAAAKEEGMFVRNVGE